MPCSMHDKSLHIEISSKLNVFKYNMHEMKEEEHSFIYSRYSVESVSCIGSE